MVVRGAPAIGVSAAMGMALGIDRSNSEDAPELTAEVAVICEDAGGDAADGGEPVLGDRPDGACLRTWRRGARSIEETGGCWREAHAMYDEDIAACKHDGRATARR